MAVLANLKINSINVGAMKLVNYVKIGQNGHLEASERFFSFLRPPIKFDFTYFPTLKNRVHLGKYGSQNSGKGRKKCKIGF